MTIPVQNNFDHLRLFLALAVFLFHTAELTQLPDLHFIKELINISVVVHAFFVVSGFLIFMSYERSSSLKSYFSKRVRRIAPAYLTVILVMFLLLSLFSSLSPGQYFTSVESWKYLLANLTTLNFLHPALPGVFEGNFLPTVDGSLWTIKIELAFYLSVPLIAYFYRLFKPTTVLITIFIASACYHYLMGHLALSNNNALYYLLQRQLPGQMLFFTAGALLYYNYGIFKKHSLLFLMLAGVGYTANTFYPVYPLYALSLAAIVVYLGTAFVYLGHIGKYGDLSYGIYIWHFPLIQLFITLGLFEESTFPAFAALLVLVIFVAWGSWHLIEKPFLTKRSHYVQESQS